MNFIIRTYLKNPCKIIKNLNIPHNELSEFFINIDDTAEIKKITKYIDKDYIDGYIFMQYKNEVILDFQLYDLIDQLWSYIIDLVKTYLVTGYASCYFPDQPILLELINITNNSNLIELHVDDKKFIFPQKKFLHALLVGAKHFFLRIKELAFIDNEEYIDRQNLITTLQNSINKTVD